MKKWLKFLLTIGLCVVAIAILRLTVFKTAPVPVTVFAVERGVVEETVVNSRAGTVKSRRRAEMSPGIPGLVTEVTVVKGSRVKQGDLLLRLDESEHRARVQLARAALEASRSMADQAQAEAEQADREWRRVQALAENQVVSEGLLDQNRSRAIATRAGSTAARARIEEMEASLQAAQATLDKTMMKAPFDGVVLDVTTEVGEWISPSPPGVFIPPVVDLIDPGALYVSAPIDEADAARIRIDLPVRITLDAFRGRSFSGRLTYVSSFVETRQEQNRTLEVEAVFTEAVPPNLLPGLSADIEIILDTRKDVLRLPTYALLEGRRVMVIQEGRLAEKPVSTGLQNWNFTEITSGLAEGDRVVVSLDRPEIKPGVRVTIAGELDND